MKLILGMVLGLIGLVTLANHAQAIEPTTAATKQDRIRDSGRSERQRDRERAVQDSRGRPDPGRLQDRHRNEEPIHRGQSQRSHGRPQPEFGWQGNRQSDRGRAPSRNADHAFNRGRFGHPPMSRHEGNPANDHRSPDRAEHRNVNRGEPRFAGPAQHGHRGPDHASHRPADMRGHSHHSRWQDSSHRERAGYAHGPTGRSGRFQPRPGDRHNFHNSGNANSDRMENPIGPPPSRRQHAGAKESDRPQIEHRTDRRRPEPSHDRHHRNSDRKPTGSADSND